MLTDSAFARARIKAIDVRALTEALDAGKIAVVAGFQGVDEAGNITTLGRGGSDTSAVAVAAALKADVCEIYTDVDGVYTADPNIVPNARKISRISYEEMLELASLGAKVLQIRSVEFGMKYAVPIHVRSSFNENEGTWVVPEEKAMEAVVVSGVTATRDEAKITMVGISDAVGMQARVFKPLAEAGIVVDVIVQAWGSDGQTNLTFTVAKGDLKRARELLLRNCSDFCPAERIRAEENLSKVSIVGVGMRSHAGVAAKMFELLAKENIGIQLISTSEIKISAVIESKYAELAVRALHEGFGLSHRHRPALTPFSPRSPDMETGGPKMSNIRPRCLPTPAPRRASNACGRWPAPTHAPPRSWRWPMRSAITAARTRPRRSAARGCCSTPAWSPARSRSAAR